MKFRLKLTLLFILIVAAIMIAASISIYFFSANYRVEDFYTRIFNKGTNTAKLLIQVEEVGPELLEKIETGNPYTLPNEKITIYNYKNDVLYNSDNEGILKVTEKFLDKIRLEGEIRFRIDQYEALGFLYIDRYDRFVVVTGATDIYGLGKLRNLQTILLIAFLISILITTVAAWIYAGKFLQPISNFIKQADEISITSLNLRLDRGSENDEMAHLAKTFNFMLDRLESSFEIQKNFIANASHEIRNPLTSITGQLEVTLLNDRPNEEYKQTIKSVLEDIKSLNTLSNRLLLLAQTSAETSDSSYENIRIDDILWATKDELIKRNNNYIVKINFDSHLDDETKLTIFGDRHLMNTAIINLLDNGCKYSKNSTVNVSVQYYVDHIALTFMNESGLILKDDLLKIFEPFHRGQNTHGIKGHGIGLSLVARIVKHHRGSINVRSNKSKITFTLRLPLKKG